MTILLVKKGRENTVHASRVTKAAGSKELPWDTARFVCFMANIGAHRIPGTDEYVDWWGWRYRLSTKEIFNNEQS